MVFSPMSGELKMIQKSIDMTLAVVRLASKFQPICGSMSGKLFVSRWVDVGEPHPQLAEEWSVEEEADNKRSKSCEDYSEYVHISKVTFITPPL
jgi:hypothetical protein